VSVTYSLWTGYLGNPVSDSVSRCQPCGLNKSPASGRNVAALSCFAKSRTRSAFNFIALLVYFRTSQKYVILLFFIDTSLLMSLYFFHEA